MCGECSHLCIWYAHVCGECSHLYIWYAHVCGECSHLYIWYAHVRGECSHPYVCVMECIKHISHECVVYSVYMQYVCTSVCMQCAAYSVQYMVCSACVQCLYIMCVYSGCMWYVVYSVQCTVCSACVQCLHAVYLVCISALPHDTMCAMIQCSMCVYSRSRSVTEVDIFRVFLCSSVERKLYLNMSTNRAGHVTLLSA